MLVTNQNVSKVDIRNADNSFNSNSKEYLEAAKSFALQSLRSVGLEALKEALKKEMACDARNSQRYIF